MTVLDGKTLAENIIKKVEQYAGRLKTRPGLAALLVGDNPASMLYVERKGELAGRLGFHFERIHLPASTSQRRVTDVLDRLSADKRINGIIVQLPLPPHCVLDEVSHHIALKKDIDCFHPDNLAKLFLGKSLPFPPPTPEAVVRLIQSSDAPLVSQHATVIGSGFFARQIAAHLGNYGSAVTLVSSSEKTLAKYTLMTDIVVTAVGRPEYLKGVMIKKGAIIIDVGITKRGSRVMGDVDFKSVAKKASAITPVPGGVGPMTLALLMENVLQTTMKY